MSKYHVYGIGNALVDMEYEVEPEDLTKLRIDKGVMTLVDETHQIEIMAYLDGCHHAKACGGSAANSVIAMSQFGGRGFYSCKVANDALGHFYLEDLLHNGVDTNRHGEREPGHTGRCVVLVTPDTDRTMVTYLGVSGGLSAGELVTGPSSTATTSIWRAIWSPPTSASAAVVAGREVAQGAGSRPRSPFPTPTW